MPGSLLLCEHLSGDCRKLLSAGWKPAFQFGRQRQRRFLAHHTSYLEQRFEFCGYMRIARQTFIDVCAAQQTIERLIEYIENHRLLTVTNHYSPQPQRTQTAIRKHLHRRRHEPSTTQQMHIPG